MGCAADRADCALKHAEDTIAAGGQSDDAEAGATAKPADKALPENSEVYGQWYSHVVRDWDKRRDEIARFYQFNADQFKASEKALDEYSDRLAKTLAGYEADIKAYRHSLGRNQEMSAEPGTDDIPNRSARMSKRLANPTGEPGVSNYVSTTPSDWRGDTEALEKSFEQAVTSVATPEQLKAGVIPESPSEIKKIDTAVIWLLIIGGACLVVGLFTRLSSVVLALFLGSVIASQPPWVAGSVTTVFNYQLVEFLALLLLASSHVGRWAGLDFFIHHVLLRPFRGKNRV